MFHVKKVLKKLLFGMVGSDNCLTLGNVALCWGTIDLAGITANEFRTGSVTYPCVFVSNPSTVMTLRDTSASPQLINWEVYDNTTTSFTWGMKSTYNGNYGTSHAYWIAIGLIGGGYSLKVFSVLSRLVRGWEYVKHQENPYESIALDTAKQENKTDSNVFLWKVVTNIKLHATNRGKHHICITCGKTKRGLDNGRHKRLWEQLMRYILQQHIQLCAFWRCRIRHSVHAVTISERGWSCA